MQTMITGITYSDAQECMEIEDDPDWKPPEGEGNDDDDEEEDMEQLDKETEG